MAHEQFLKVSWYLWSREAMYDASQGPLKGSVSVQGRLAFASEIWQSFFKFFSGTMTTV